MSPVTAGRRVGGPVRWTVALLLAVLLLVPATAGADGAEMLNPRLDASGFPAELVFTADLKAPAPITEAQVVMNLGSRNVAVTRPATLVPSGDVTAARAVLNIRADAHIPPGTQVRYRFRVTAGGQQYETNEVTTVYLDPRFRWQSVQDGIFTVYYYDVPESRARIVLDQIKRTNEEMAGVVGVTIDRETKAVMYNSRADMEQALRFRSETTSRELVTEGVAYADLDLFLTLGADRDVIAHEFTHLLVGKAADNAFGGIPSWLNEGLAVYSQSDPGPSYRSALTQGIRADRVLPLRGMDAPPGQPDMVIMFYGQSWSVVQYLLDTYGPESMRRLLAGLKANQGLDAAARAAYGGRGIAQIDQEWRAAVGLPPVPGGQPAPTAVPGGQAKPQAPTTPQPATKAPATPVAGTPVAPAASAPQAPGPGIEVILIAGVGAMLFLLVAGIGVIAIALGLRRGAS